MRADGAFGVGLGVASGQIRCGDAGSSAGEHCRVKRGVDRGGAGRAWQVASYWHLKPLTGSPFGDRLGGHQGFQFWVLEKGVS